MNIPILSAASTVNFGQEYFVICGGERRRAGDGEDLTRSGRRIEEACHLQGAKDLVQHFGRREEIGAKSGHQKDFRKDRQT
jgi:hypothetical protein